MVEQMSCKPSRSWNKYYILEQKTRKMTFKTDRENNTSSSETRLNR